MSTIVYNTPPHDFRPKVEVAGCYCEWNGKLLFMRRHPDKHQGGTWGVPGGKLEEGETPVQGAIRELYEEAGILLGAADLQPISSLYVRNQNGDYIFHRFRAILEELPKLNIALEEHDEARWVTKEEAFELPLIAGGKEALLSYLQDKKISES